MNTNSRQAEHMETLAELVIGGRCEVKQSRANGDTQHLRRDLHDFATLSTLELESLLELASSHHVVVRALMAMQNAAVLQDEKRVTEWRDSALDRERERIARAVRFLQLICDTLEARGCSVAVIKSLDHWPDLGSDLDLYTTADEHQIGQVMREEFDAKPVERSWGDRLANKWNYAVPGLPELVEIHVRYLGQTGEHAELARRIIERGVIKKVAGYTFRVPRAEERIIISALQRVYRHFYFRLCDMVDFALLLETETIDFAELKRVSDCAGIWRGIATFLCLIRNYVNSYGGNVALPDEVMKAAYHGRSSVHFEDGFLRVSKTTAVALYASQLLLAGQRGDGRALRRLPLLPPLAVSALVAHRLSGNDKGIW